MRTRLLLAALWLAVAGCEASRPSEPAHSPNEPVEIPAWTQSSAPSGPYAVRSGTVVLSPAPWVPQADDQAVRPSQPSAPPPPPATSQAAPAGTRVMGFGLPNVPPEQQVVPEAPAP